MAKLTDGQMSLIRQVVDEAVQARRRNSAKSARPEFKVVYDREVAELLSIKPVLEVLNGESNPRR